MCCRFNRPCRSRQPARFAAPAARRPDGDERIVYVRDETNAAGLVGFILSCLGLFGSCGVLSPVGLIVSLVGLGKRPRGFAIAGVLLGLIGLGWIALVVVVAVLGGIAAMIGLVATAIETGSIEAGIDRYEIVQIAEAVEQYEQNTGALPTTIAQLADLDGGTLEDRWGTPYHYEPDYLTGEFKILSDGPDMQRGTDDDILLWDSVGEDGLQLDDDPAFEELERRMEDGDRPGAV